MRSRNRFAADSGPIGWELDFPMPILKTAKTERNMEVYNPDTGQILAARSNSASAYVI